MRKLVLIEFTTATTRRAVGFRMRCDAMSATSFCDQLKVATRVGSTPPPVVVVEVEPEDTPPTDVDNF